MVPTKASEASEADDGNEDNEANEANNDNKDDEGHASNEDNKSYEHHEEGQDELEDNEEDAATSQEPPKKAVKSAATGKAKAAPALPTSPLFAGPHKSFSALLKSDLIVLSPVARDAKAVQDLPVEMVGHDLVTDAVKPPFINQGPPACTNCISCSHDCQPAPSGHSD
jgi:hypothetical protein